MFRSIRLNRNRTIALPATIFHPMDRVAILLEGNTVIIKKIIPTKLSEIGSKTTKNSLPLNEIVKEIQRYRKEKRK